MTGKGAHQAVTTSAVVVTGMFAYRKLTAPSPAAVPQTGHFLLGAMVIYVTLGALADAAPELVGMMAILIMVGDLLANGIQVSRQINSTLKSTSSQQKGGG